MDLAPEVLDQRPMTGVQSVERALDILRALAVGPAGVTDIADRIGLPKSTVSRMLATLEARGAVERVEGSTEYKLGPLVAEIARTMSPGRPLLELAAPVLDELTRLTGEASGLAVREGSLVRFVLQTRPASEVQVRDWTGTTAPLHVGPSGLVMLAFTPKATIDAYLSLPLVSFTDRTVTDADAIRERLDRIRAVGSEWVFAEFSTELNSVAAPVFDIEGDVIAAVHVHGPTFRFPGSSDPNDMAARLREAGARLTELVRRSSQLRS